MRLALALVIALGSAGAASADVVSTAPERAEVTIYRDRPVSTEDLANLDQDDDSGLALITETRPVDLPAGESRVRFEGVADGIIPESATVEGLPGGVVERNFDYDLMSPGALIAAMVGRPVTIVRTDRKTGKETRETAVLRSGPDGVVLQLAGGVEALKCSGGPERLVFDQVPAGLADRPTLSALVLTDHPGRYVARVSYLTVRMDWSADYIARIAADGKSLDLTGWITLANRTAVSFKDAPTAVVAGRLARAPVDLPDVEDKPVRLNCWPNETTHSGWRYRPRINGMLQTVPTAITAAPAAEAAEEIMVTAEKRVGQSNLGDYKLYTLAEPTTVAARQTKQVQFLHQPAVRFETVHVAEVDVGPGDTPDPDGEQPTQIVLRLENKPESGLGQPLPAGMVQVRRPGGMGELYVGGYGLRDVPVGEPFEISTGDTTEVSFRRKVVSDTTGGWLHKRERISLEVTAINDEDQPVTVEVRQPRGVMRGFRLDSASAPHGTRAGDPVWRLALAPGGRTVLRYTVSLDP